MSALQFRWRAVTDAGQFVDGVLSAADEQGAMDALRRERLHPVELAPVLSSSGREWASRATTCSAWIRTLATLLGGGVTLDRALVVAAREARHPAVARSVADIGERVRAGSTLADALDAQYGMFPATVVAMVRAWEHGGVMTDALARAAAWTDERDALRAELRAQLLYPAVMGVAAVLGISVILLAVIPRFVGMIGDLGGTPPWSTRGLVLGSTLATRGWWMALLSIAGGSLAWTRWRRDAANRRRFHGMLLRLPVVGTWVRERATAQWGQTVGALLQSGVPLLTALRIAPEGEANGAIAERMERAADAVAHGGRLAAALDGVLPPTAVQLVAAGEESGRLGELCLRVGDTYEAAARRSLRSLVGLVEPAMVLGFGALVGFVALGMLQAIYSVNGMVLR